jgi:hypothetical protein
VGRAAHPGAWLAPGLAFYTLSSDLSRRGCAAVAWPLLAATGAARQAGRRGATAARPCRYRGIARDGVVVLFGVAGTRAWTCSDSAPRGRARTATERSCGSPIRDIIPRVRSVRAARDPDRVRKGAFDDGTLCLRLQRGSGVRRWGLEGRGRGRTWWGSAGGEASMRACPRACRVVLALVALLRAAAPVAADEVLFSNGDRLEDKRQ